MTQVILADGSSSGYHYNIAGNPTRITDPAGNNWNYAYDAQGNLTSMIDPTGVMVQLAYNAHGSLIRREDGQGSAVEYGYDQQHRLIRITDPLGHSSQLERDVFGRVIGVIDAKTHRTEYAYQPQTGRPFHEPSHIRYADGSMVERRWDSEGLLVSHQDAQGNQTRYQYDAFDLLSCVTDPQGGVFRLDYDAAERLQAITNPLGEQWQFERDAAGQVVRESDFADRENRFHYDVLGRLIARQQVDGVVTRYQYDAVGHLVWQGHYAADNALAQQSGVNLSDITALTDSESRYSYDTRGLLQAASNAHSEITFKRDAAGRITEESQNGDTLRHTYDLISGRRQLLELPSGAETQFSYGPLGMLLKAQLSDHEPLRFSYDERGQEISRHSASGFQLQQQWDVMGRLEQQFSSHYDPLHPASHVPDPQASIQRQYQYDPLDNLTGIKDPHQGEQSYAYNPNQQITAAAHGQQKEHFNYDAAGNIQDSGQQGESLQGLADNVVDLREWTHNKGGAVAKQQGGQQPTDYQYDARGRLIEKTEHKPGFRPQVWRYQWDVEGRLTRLSTPGNTDWHYTYDALGRRIEKRRGTDPQSPDNTPDHHRTRYLWDGATMVEEVPVYADGQPVWAQATTWHYEPESFVPLAKQTHKNDQLYYVVTDHLGTPRELVTEQGAPVWQQQYSVWGKALHLAANDDAIDCNLRFQGQYFDAESGLHYNYHRYYDPESAQYLTPDPIGLLGGMRPQGYVENPNGWIDPFGLNKDDCLTAKSSKSSGARKS